MRRINIKDKLKTVGEWARSVLFTCMRTTFCALQLVDIHAQCLQTERREKDKNNDMRCDGVILLDERRKSFEKLRDFSTKVTSLNSFLN